MSDDRIFLEEEEGIDLRKWFFLILDHWLLFVVFCFFAVFTAFVYNSTTTEEYSLSTSILIKEDANPLDKGDIIQLTLRNDPYRLENEVGIIRSSILRKQTLKQLDFYTEYFLKKTTNERELYKASPFVVYFDKFHEQPVNSRFNIGYINDSLITIEMYEEDVQLYDYSTLSNRRIVAKFEFADTISWGDTIETPNMKFSVWPRYKLPKEDMDNLYAFEFKSLLHLSNRYSLIDIKIPKSSSIITLSLTHNNPEKAKDYLNAFVLNYLNRGIEKEVRVAQLTIDFIDAQLTTIIDSLQMSEQKLEDFRSENQLVNIDYQAQQVYTRHSDLEKQKAELIIQQKYLEYLSDNLQTDVFSPENLVAPSNMGITDPVLNNLIMELVEQYNERTELKLNTKKDNPYVNSLNAHIESTKSKLYETVNNLLRSTRVSLQELNVQISILLTRLSELPKDQRELLNFQRNFELNDELYTYLMTRRSEMQIIKASILPNNELLEEAAVDVAILTHPNSKVNYIIGLFFGLLIPFLYIYIKVFLNHRIQSHEELSGISKEPLMGVIHKNEDLELPVVSTAPQSVVAESFRMLRANLQFVMKANESAVFAVSSAMQGEGKSFVAINLAAVYAAYGKKVCLLDLDLRRPRLAKYLDAPNEVGLSNCLIGQKKISEIKQHHKVGGFDYFTSGPIPPNPSELVSSKNLDGIIESLKHDYDLVIMDTPPIGIVSDALNLSKAATHLMLVVRHNVTIKPMLSTLLNNINRNHIEGVNLVYNDVPVGRKGYYRYGYRYGYSYDENKSGFLSRIFSRK